MADNISQIDPSLKVPGVPDYPRAQVSESLVRGIGDLAQGVDRVMMAKQSMTEQMRQARDAAIGNAGTDPRQTSGAFHQAADQSIEQHAATVQTPQEQAAVRAHGQDLKAVYGHTVGQAARATAMQQVRDRLGQNLSGLAQDAAASDAGAQIGVLRKAATDMIDQHVKVGLITPQEGQAYAAGYGSDVQENQLRLIAKQDPAEAQRLLGEGHYTDIQPARAKALADELATKVGMRNAGDTADLTHLVGQLSSSLTDQAPPPSQVLDELTALAQRTGNTDALRAASAAQSGIVFANKLATLPVQDGYAQWQKLKTDPTPSPEKDAALAYGEGMLRGMVNKLQTDPLSFAAQHGLVDPVVINWQQPDPAALKERAHQARAIQQFYRLDQPVFLNDQERSQLAETFRQAPPDQKEGIMRNVFTAFGSQDGAKVFSQMSDISQAEAHLAALAAYGGGRNDTALRGFRGQQAIAAKAVTMPDEASMARVEQYQIGNLFDMRLAQSRASVIAAARALYAERTVTRGLATFDAPEYAKALHEAMGRSDAGGGIGLYNGRKIMLPMDLNQEQFTHTIGALQPADLARLSVGGNAPAHVTLSGKVIPATPEDVRAGTLVQSGYGRWRVSMTNPDAGPPQFLVDGKTGQYYELNLADAAHRPHAQKMQPVVTRFGQGLAPVYPPPPGKDQSRVPPPPVKDQARLPQDPSAPAPAQSLIAPQ